jgi:hypothetical protein
MKHSKNKDKNDDVIKGIGMVIPKLPSLIIKSAGAYLRFKKDVKNAGKIFEKELKDQGIDDKTASELTKLYLDGSNILKNIMEKNYK